MQCKTKGCYGESEYFFHTASTLAKDLFYYMDDCGHIFCGKDYMIRRQVYNNYLLMYVVSGQLNIENDGITHSVYPHQVVLMNCHNAHRYGSPAEALLPTAAVQLLPAIPIKIISRVFWQSAANFRAI